MGDCVFCGIAAGREPAARLYEDDLCLAFMDIHPIRPGHLLVIPREHAQHLLELPEATRERIFQVGQRLLQAVQRSEIPSDAFNLVINDGAAAGQTVAHVHLHIVPRTRGDVWALVKGLISRLTRRMGRPVPYDRLETDATAIKRALNNG